MSSEPHVALNLQHRIGSVALDVAFATSAPWTVIFGPSGSGKSTLLRAIAGLLRPDHGTIFINGQLVCDTVRNVCFKPQARPVRWSAQHPTLFPHLSVIENIAFGVAHQHGARSSRTRDTVAAALKHFRLEPLAGRSPAQLSGGEQRRVALARAAIGARGKLLLLDEPFTGLDAAVRDHLIGDLRGWLNGTPVVSVTHDVSEAFLLRAEVVRLSDGNIAAQGTPASVLDDERECLRALLS